MAGKFALGGGPIGLMGEWGRLVGVVASSVFGGFSTLGSLRVVFVINSEEEVAAVVGTGVLGGLGRTRGAGVRVVGVVGRCPAVQDAFAEWDLCLRGCEVGRPPSELNKALEGRDGSLQGMDGCVGASKKGNKAEVASSGAGNLLLGVEGPCPTGELVFASIEPGRTDGVLLREEGAVPGGVGRF